jgi:hypothetical protein
MRLAARIVGLPINKSGTGKVGESKFMRRIATLILASLLLVSVGRCEVPTVNLPLDLRQANWVGESGEGSCVHAAIVNLLRWQQEYAEADHWHDTYANGEYADDSWNYGDNLARKFNSEGVPYAYTVEGDVKFLEWAISTRRGAGITVKGGRHMVVLVYLDNEKAGLLDSNDVSHVIYVDRDRLIAEWQNSHGWAVTTLYSPAPPLPVRK